MTKLVDFRLKDNTALVELLSTKDSNDLLTQAIELCKNQTVNGVAIVGTQKGSVYACVKILAVGDQVSPETGAQQLEVKAGDIAVVALNSISIVDGVTVDCGSQCGLVYTENLIALLETRGEEDA